MFALPLVAAALLMAAPVDTEARLRAGRSALAAHDYAAAKKEFAAALSSDPGNAAANVNLGILALVEDDAAAGLRYFSAVPGDSRAMIGRLDCELRLRRVDEARRTAKQLEGMIAADPAASGHVGTLLAKSGEYAAAIPFLRRATGAAAANLLGTAEEKSGDLQAASKAFAEAVRLDPANEDYRLDLAAVLLNSGDVERSIAAFQAAAKDFPRSARVRLGMGSALYLAGRHEAAARALLEAVRLQPDARAIDLLGKAYESAGELQPEIQREFEKYLSAEPRDAVAYSHYGTILRISGGDAGAARRALTRAVALDKNLAAAHLQLGILEQNEGNSAAALKEFEIAARLQPGDSTVHYRLAGIYQKLGESERAKSEMEEFRRLKAQEKR